MTKKGQKFGDFWGLDGSDEEGIFPRSFGLWLKAGRQRDSVMRSKVVDIFSGVFGGRQRAHVHRPLHFSLRLRQMHRAGKNRGVCGFPLFLRVVGTFLDTIWISEYSFVQITFGNALEKREVENGTGGGC